MLGNSVPGVFSVFAAAEWKPEISPVDDLDRRQRMMGARVRLLGQALDHPDHDSAGYSGNDEQGAGGGQKNTKSHVYSPLVSNTLSALSMSPAMALTPYQPAG